MASIYSNQIERYYWIEFKRYHIGVIIENIIIDIPNETKV